MKDSFKKSVIRLLVILCLSLAFTTMTWGDSNNSSTCKHCGHTTVFTQQQIEHEVLYCENCGALTMIAAELPEAKETPGLGWGTDEIPPEDIEEALDPVGVSPQVTDSIAWEDSGSNQSTGVKTAVVVGLVSALAAAAAAAGGGSGLHEGDMTRQDQEDALNKKGEYQMVIYKTFGAIIEKDKTNQVIYARMEQHQSDGSWAHIPAMDSQISIFMASSVDGLYLDPPPLKPLGVGKGCTLRLENEEPPPEAIISFKFQGPDAYFQNNMTFGLETIPKIKIPHKFCLLGTSTEVCEVAYEVSGLAGKPDVSLRFKSDLFDLQLGKDQSGKDVILAKATQKAGKMNFKRFIHRYPCEITAKTDKAEVTEKFQVHLCYEGVGTAYEGLGNSETPEPIILTCFPEGEKDKRLSEAVRIPLTVMRWNQSLRELEVDPDAIGALGFDFIVDTRSKDLRLEEAVKVLEQSRMVTEIEPGPSPIKLDFEKQPGIYRIYPNASPLAGAPEIKLQLTISDPKDLVGPLVLFAELKPQLDFRGMIQWFLNYPRGTELANFIDLGDNGAYLKALDHIENRVYHRDKIPLMDNTMIMHRAADSYYEHGKGDIMRKPYIALVRVPKGIGDYDAIRTLYHELTHTLEDIVLDERDGSVASGSERRTYFLQFLADAAFTLAEIERTGVVMKIGEAISAMTFAFHDAMVIGAGTIQQDITTFGAKCTVTSHELFAYYATSYNGPHAQAIRQEVRRRYFPGNISQAADMHVLMADARQREGTFVEEDGCFKGGQWTFRWNGGLLSRVGFKHPDFETTVTQWEWLPDKGLGLSLVVEMEDKKNRRKDKINVIMDGGWVSPKRISFARVNQFNTTWKTQVGTWDSILYNLTNGWVENHSLTRR